MSKVKYDIKRVPRELLEEAVKYNTRSFYSAHHDGCLSKSELAVRQAAAVPLRTKAEVDADIAKAVRDYVKFNGRNNNCQNFAFDSYIRGCDSPRFCEVIHALINEETSD